MTRDAARVDLDRAPVTAILQPGRNCWHRDRADRFSSIQDAADYFRLVRQALLAARETVFILGWDTTATVDLDPGAPPDGAPTRLDRLLRHVAKKRPRLRCYILTWDYGSLYTLERDPFTRWRLGWRMPGHVRFGFDDRHPVGASHHQKVVVVDDQLAFCGGVDLTVHRWDTSAHRLEEPARVTPLGKVYGPYHEVQAMLSGAAAASLGVLARDRWRALGAERLPPVGTAAHDLWPAALTADLTDVDVAISRTMPGSEAEPAVRECEALFLDSIAAARRAIYIESQYFTNHVVGRALGARLREPDGPEVIIVAPKECEGWLEKKTMGAFRDTVFRALRGADTHQRLRFVYPAASRAQDVPVFVHSKVMIVDDVFVRIGSANCSHRSMGMDSECDVAVEAGGSATVREGIRRIRDRMLAEHLDMRPGAVGAEIERAGTLRALIDARAHGDRTLVAIETPPDAPEGAPDLLKAAADPDEPFSIGAVDYLIPAVDAAHGRVPLRIWLLPLVCVLAAGAVAWASPGIAVVPAVPIPAWLGVAGFVVAGLVLVPLEVLAIAAGAMSGGSRGAGVALAGSFFLAVAGYWIGRAVGPARLEWWLSRRSYRTIRQLGSRRIGGVIALHLAAVASAGAIHLLSGAGRVPFLTYLGGAAIGLVPSVAALSGLGGLLRRTLLDPSVANASMTVGAAVVLLLLAAVVRTLLLFRQFAPSVTGHRDRAEFG
jgi:phospholipase D1/2